MNTNSGEQLRLKAEHIAKTYTTGVWPLQRKNEVLTDASLEVRQGEIDALVGANGSGKSTLMMIIAGALSRNAGEVKTNGTVGYCPQYPILYEKLTVDETFGLFGTAITCRSKILNPEPQRCWTNWSLTTTETTGSST